MITNQGKKSSSSTASNNQDSIQEPPFTIDQKTCLNSGAQMNSPFTNLDRLMLDEINLARRDPKEYSKKLKNLLYLIKANPSNNKIHLLYDDDLKIKLKKGATTFKSCIEYLKAAPTVKPIELVDDLAIPFPHSNPKQCLNKDYIGECIENIRAKVENKYEIYDFQYDISPNPVLSTIIQVVDDSDSHYQRRGNIMSENVKYVGISYGEIKKGVFCFYLLFAC